MGTIIMAAVNPTRLSMLRGPATPSTTCEWSRCLTARTPEAPKSTCIVRSGQGLSQGLKTRRFSEFFFERAPIALIQQVVRHRTASPISDAFPRARVAPATPERMPNDAQAAKP